MPLSNSTLELIEEMAINESRVQNIETSQASLSKAQKSFEDCVYRSLGDSVGGGGGGDAPVVQNALLPVHSEHIRKKAKASTTETETVPKRDELDIQSLTDAVNAMATQPENDAQRSELYSTVETLVDTICAQKPLLDAEGQRMLAGLALRVDDDDGDLQTSWIGYSVGKKALQVVTAINSHNTAVVKRNEERLARATELHAFGGVGNEEATCCFCFETVKTGVDEEVTHCGHKFHGACVGAWKEACVRNYARQTCPLCRANIASEPKESEEPEPYYPSLSNISLLPEDEQPQAMFRPAVHFPEGQEPRYASLGSVDVSEDDPDVRYRSWASAAESDARAYRGLAAVDEAPEITAPVQ